MEQAIVSGIAHDRSEAKVTVNRVPDRPGVAASLFGALAEAGVNVDMIVQNVSHDGSTDISFTVPRAKLVDAERISKQVAGEIDADSVDVDADIAKVSLVGAGMKTDPSVAAEMSAPACRNARTMKSVPAPVTFVACRLDPPGPMIATSAG